MLKYVGAIAGFLTFMWLTNGCANAQAPTGTPQRGPIEVYRGKTVVKQQNFIDRGFPDGRCYDSEGGGRTFVVDRVRMSILFERNKIVKDSMPLGADGHFSFVKKGFQYTYTLSGQIDPSRSFAHITIDVSGPHLHCLYEIEAHRVHKKRAK